MEYWDRANIWRYQNNDIKVTLLHCSNFDKPFNIHIGSSGYQIGAVITQKGPPITYWLKKFSDVQKKYPTSDQELLAILNASKGTNTLMHTISSKFKWMLS